MRHIFGLDIIRFLAALLVLLNHFATYSATLPALAATQDDRAFAFLAVFEGVGAIGVQVFFVISGFVIAMSAKGLSGRPGALRFGLARALRILPALWISGLVSFFALWLVGQMGADPVANEPLALLDRLLRSAILSPIGPYIDGVVWSLIVEAVFYTLIACVILGGSRIPLRLLALCLGAASCLYLSGCILVALLDNAALESLLNRFPFKVFLLRHGVFFAIGMLIFDRLEQSQAAGRPCTSHLSRSVFVLLCGFGLAEIWLGLRGTGLSALAAILLFLAGLLALELSLRRRAAPRFPGLYRYLGSMSYTIYLNHYTTGMVIVYLLAKTSLSGLSLFVVSLLAVLLLSHAVLVLETRIRTIAKPRLAAWNRHPAPAE
jgi:peptidoglycan/LPS O-acetylase OafA/YrhL